MRALLRGRRLSGITRASKSRRIDASRHYILSWGGEWLALMTSARDKAARALEQPLGKCARQAARPFVWAPRGREHLTMQMGPNDEICRLPSVGRADRKLSLPRARSALFAPRGDKSSCDTSFVGANAPEFHLCGANYSEISRGARLSGGFRRPPPN